MTHHALDTAQTDRQRRLEVMLWTIAAFAIRLYHLEYRGLWTDEFHTLQPILMPVGDLIRERLGAGHLPTYFLLMKGWVALAGISDWTLRFPSVVFGALLIPAAASLGRQFLSWRDVRLLMLVACVNGMAVWSSQEARMYSMLAFAATMAHACYFRTLQAGSARTWIIYIWWVVIAASLQPLMVMFFIAHLAFSARVRKAYPVHARAAARLGFAALVVGIPAVVLYVMHQSEVKSLRVCVPSVVALVKSLQLLAFSRPAWYEVAKFLVPLVFLGCIIGLVRGRRVLAGFDSLQACAVRFCLALVVVPAALLYFIAVFVERSVSMVGVERYLIPCAVPLWILLIWGVRHSRPRMRGAMIVGVALCLLLGLAGRWADRGTGMREAARYLAAHARPGEVVLMRDSQTMAMALSYYGARQVRPCLVAQDDTSTSAILREVSACAGGQACAWLFIYRDDRQTLRRALETQKDVFRPGLIHEEARAALVRYDIDSKRLELLGSLLPQPAPVASFQSGQSREGSQLVH